MPSHLSSRRIPRQARAERRITELLEAAAEVIAEVGYDATTMTAIAERAGASIGAVYQYFPNKEAVVRALRLQYGEEMQARWTAVAHEAAGASIEVLVSRIFRVLVDFWDYRPAYIPLLNAPTQYRRDPAARNRLRGHFADLFRTLRPDLTAAEAFRIAQVALQIVKGLHPLYGEASAAERRSLLGEFEAALTAYLQHRLRPPALQKK